MAITGVEKAIVLLLGGEPLGERFVEWNFVSSSRERIAQAKADWRAGRLKLPDLDDHEWIPLPSDPRRPLSRCRSAPHAGDASRLHSRQLSRGRGVVHETWLR